MEAVEVDFSACFSCAVAIPVSDNKHATAITSIFIFLLLKRLRRLSSRQWLSQNPHPFDKLTAGSLAKSARRVGAPIAFSLPISYLQVHASVWTSTDSTAGRSRTIGLQLSPASAEQ